MAARLRLPAGMPDAEKEERVEGLIKRLGLTGAADTVVGDEKACDARGACARLTLGVQTLYLKNVEA